MGIRESLSTWYLKNVLIPGTEAIGSPGFVITRFTAKNKAKQLRDLILPERFFAELEQQVVAKYGENGARALYSAGKKFGYAYASLSEFPQMDKVSRGDWLGFVDGLTLYAGAVYTSGIERETDYESRANCFHARNFAVCRLTGKGHIFAEGGIGGMWAYLANDPGCEAVQMRCTGRGDQECEIFMGPGKWLSGRGLRFFNETSLDAPKTDARYTELNRVRPTKFAKKSLRDLIQTGFFTYREGVLSFRGERYVNCESHMLYYLENALAGLPDGEPLLAEISRGFGKSIAQGSGVGGHGLVQFITDYFSALGWGDVGVVDAHEHPMVFALAFPYTEFAEGSKQVIFLGLVSGVLSHALGREVRLRLGSSPIRSGALDLKGIE